MIYIKIRISSESTKEVHQHILGFPDFTDCVYITSIVSELKKDFVDNSECQLTDCSACMGCNHCYCDEEYVSEKEAKVLSDLNKILIEYH